MKLEGLDDLADFIGERADILEKLSEALERYKDEDNALELAMADVGLRVRPRPIPLMEKDRAQEIADETAEAETEEEADIIMAIELYLEELADRIAGD